MQDKIDQHDKDIRQLQVNYLELTKALNSIANTTESRKEHIDYRFNEQTERFNKLDSAIGKLLWLIGAAIVGGVMQFVINGGLNSV